MNLHEWVTQFRNEFKYPGSRRDQAETHKRIERIIALIEQPVPKNWQRYTNISQTGGTLGPRRGDKDQPECESAVEHRMFKRTSWRIKGGRNLKLLPLINEQYLGNEKLGQVRVDAVGYLDYNTSKVIAAIEIKDKSNHCWHAVVENVIQILLIQHLPKALTSSHSEWQHFRDGDFTQTVGVILAPDEFYTMQGQRSVRVEDAKQLIQAVWDRCRLKIYLLSFLQDETHDEDTLDLIFEPS